ncbi:MAG: TldD/PmbA family protein, partial [Rhodothermales bacterium]|nr:TldD/PmbA family protein [Rhodothermales bacterium]
AQPVAPGAGPVVLAAGWGGVWLHEAVGHLLEADVLAGSPLAGRLGTRVAIPDVTLVDDPTHPDGRATYAFDDEGVPATRTTLIDGGVLRAALTDRRHASSTPSTGNGRRQDYRHRPFPRMSNLLLLGGTASPEDLLAGVQEGLYVTAVGHGVVRPGIGFAVDVLDGFRIERGRLGAPVAGVRLIGSGPGMLAVLDGIGTDFRLDPARGVCEKQGQVVPVSVGMPAVRVRAMQAVPVDAE